MLNSVISTNSRNLMNRSSLVSYTRGGRFQPFLMTNIFTVCNSSCRKVMFLHLSIILSTGGGLPLGPGDGQPLDPGGSASGSPQADTPQSDTPRQTLPRQTTPQADTPPPGRHPLGRPTPEIATAVDGIHPNGMHSCLSLNSTNSVETFRKNSNASLVALQNAFVAKILRLYFV